MRSQSRRALAGIAAAIAVTAQGAGAADPGPPPQVSPRTACMHDYWKFCLGVPPFTGLVRQCLMKHVDALSDQCRAAGLQAELAAGRVAPVSPDPGVRAAPPSNTVGEGARPTPAATP
jgi:hypothetical protein